MHTALLCTAPNPFGSSDLASSGIAKENKILVACVSFVSRHSLRFELFISFVAAISIVSTHSLQHEQFFQAPPDVRF